MVLVEMSCGTLDHHFNYIIDSWIFYAKDPSNGSTIVGLLYLRPIRILTQPIGSFGGCGPNSFTRPTGREEGGSDQSMN
jgi:hypothetical protein